MRRANSLIIVSLGFILSVGSSLAQEVPPENGDGGTREERQAAHQERRDSNGNMSTEERAAMRERRENMSDGERKAMREKRQANGGRKGRDSQRRTGDGSRNGRTRRNRGSG